jgi:hypothetical protein
MENNNENEVEDIRIINFSEMISMLFVTIIMVMLFIKIIFF